MPGQQKFLVVGGDSMIGDALARAWQKDGLLVLRTTRRTERLGEGRIFLDLAHVPSGWQPPAAISAAVLCGAVSRLEQCRQDPAASSAVNVAGTLAVAQRLIEAGALVIFLSTNHVFDGTKSCRKAGDPLSPVTEYGRQKAAVEEALRRWPRSVAIARLTKVIGSSETLFASWVRAWRAGEVVTPFSDLRLAPVPLSGAVAVLDHIIRRRLSGIWQISGEADMTYAEAAQFGARLCAVDPSLIRPIRAADSGRFFERVAEHTTLDVSSLEGDLGVTLPPVRWTLEQAFCNPHVLDGV